MDCCFPTFAFSMFNMENDWLLNIGTYARKQKTKCMKTRVIPCVSWITQYENLNVINFNQHNNKIKFPFARQNGPRVLVQYSIPQNGRYVCFAPVCRHAITEKAIRVLLGSPRLHGNSIASFSMRIYFIHQLLFPIWKKMIVRAYSSMHAFLFVLFNDM